MSERPWMKFYPADWRADPALNVCSISARGLWMELLCIMHEASPRGLLLVNGRTLSEKQIASICGIQPKQASALLAELEAAGAFNRNENGVIYSRRMIREGEQAAKNVEAGQSGGNPNIRRGTVPKDARTRPFRRSDSPAKTRRIFERDGGRCHWCNVALVCDFPPGQDLPANFFHVDHVVAVCDGGTNDESNLVAACAACNHKRARNPIPTLTRVGVGKRPDSNSDNKAYMLEVIGREGPIQEEEPSIEGEDCDWGTSDLPPAGRLQ